MLVFFTLSSMAIVVAGGINEDILPLDGSSPVVENIVKDESSVPITQEIYNARFNQ